jgi:hypothetical protein
MSNHSIIPLAGGREIQPRGDTRGPKRKPGSALGALGAAAGMGLLILLPGAAVADGYSYGSAEVTLGLPHATISVGKTWESRPREVIVERVTHKLPETDFEEEETEEYSEADVIEEEDAPEEQIIIEKRRPRVARKVTIIERYEEPEYCERETVVRKVYVEPPCDRTEVIVHAAPRRVVYAPAPTVIVHSPRRVHKVVRVYGGGHGRSGHGGGGHGHGGAIQVHHGPRNLFPEGSGRPMRARGSRNLVQVGAHGHSH